MIAEISLAGLAIAFIPALVVIAIMVFWHSIAATALYATARMLVQLLLIGYVLVYIFESDNWLVILGVLTIMLFASGWIATRTLDSRSTHSFLQALGSIAIGGLLTLALFLEAADDAVHLAFGRRGHQLLGLRQHSGIQAQA